MSDEYVTPEQAALYKQWKRGENKPKVTRAHARKEVRTLKRQYKDELILREHLQDDIAEVEKDIKELVGIKKEIAVSAAQRAQLLMQVEIDTTELTEMDRANAVEKLLRITQIMPGVNPDENRGPGGLSQQAQQVLVNIRQDFGKIEAKTLVDAIVSEDVTEKISNRETETEIQQDPSNGTTTG